jgi:hypothetical protein
MEGIGNRYNKISPECSSTSRAEFRGYHLRQRAHQLGTVELAGAGIVVRRIERFLLDAVIQERPKGVRSAALRRRSGRIVGVRRRGGG